MTTIQIVPLSDKGKPVAAQTIQLPKGARILCVVVQNGLVCLHALVDNDKPLEPMVIRTIDPGVETPGIQSMVYVGTYQVQDRAYHVFHDYLTTASAFQALGQAFVIKAF